MGQQQPRPKKVRDYEILDELGRGAFGVVYKAKNSKGMLFAVKSMLNTTAEEVTQKELDMAAHISKHDNIVSIHEYFTERGPDRNPAQAIYIIMEFCEGGDLNDHVIQKKPDVAERLGFLVDMARGVNYLHNIKVIHRDLKPQNILLAKTGDSLTCKVSDFGIANVQKDNSDYFTTQCGTLPYVPPEMIFTARYTFSADVFALGLVYFAVMTGTTVNNKGEQLLLPAVEVGGKPQLLADLVRRNSIKRQTFVAEHFSFSEELGQLVCSMIEQDPDKRPGMDLVIAKVAEIKGATMARARQSGSTETAGAATTGDNTHVEILKMQNQLLLQCLADLQEAFTQAQRLTRRASGRDDDDDVYLGSFQEDAVCGVIRVRRGVFDSGVGFDDMGSFTGDAEKGVIQVINGSSDSGFFT